MNAHFKQELGLQTPWHIESVAFNPESKRLDIHVNFTRNLRFGLPDGNAIAVR